MKRHATISLGKDGGFDLRFEGHAVQIPATEAGLAALHRILRARDTEGAGNIAREAQPTQYQVDAWLKAAKAEERRKAQAAADAVTTLTLEDLGL